VSVTTTFLAGTVPEFEATSRKVPTSPTAIDDEPTTLLVIPTSTVPGVNVTAAWLSAKLSGSQVRSVKGTTAPAKALFVTCMPALSGVSVDEYVITRCSPGPKWGISPTTTGKSEPGGAPRLSPVGSKRQTPVPPEIEIAVGGFCNPAGRRSAATTSTVPGPSLWTVNV
jgi:hypothetical protein